MTLGVTVAEVFAAAGLTPSGPSVWGQPIEEKRPGVYILALTADPNCCFGRFDQPPLPPHLAHKWLMEEPVVYIGRTRRSLRHRIGQFYRHKYGKKAPHRGGEAILLLKPLPLVFWAATDAPADAERMMIDAFRWRTGALPFANRCRAARAASERPVTGFQPKSDDAGASQERIPSA